MDLRDSDNTVDDFALKSYGKYIQNKCSYATGLVAFKQPQWILDMDSDMPGYIVSMEVSYDKFVFYDSAISDISMFDAIDSCLSSISDSRFELIALHKDFKNGVNISSKLKKLLLKNLSCKSSMYLEKSTKPKETQFFHPLNEIIKQGINPFESLIKCNRIPIYA